ncbi:putative membrane protein [Wickerhamomyces ciferrii]|uniref:Membrane protein n=1 Tax=Wickerhamomyces ciferrii (strain ATCC 14091 / BCRC 22168 / CBS 111 / JCM 3599 / NBRC 0793 / NRRL Y-1031 F-60-10) TaxID=1206466 RepID=K0KIL8_WICCF|nr:uncharacterized protein BN7_2371 [Wickerhamomyces ciferrii]CCH42826.1 putative membrane protein [Wickerhamomyces ciferrii]
MSFSKGDASYQEFSSDSVTPLIRNGNEGKKVTYKDADVVLKFLEANQDETRTLSIEESDQLDQKNFKIVIFLVSLVTLVLFMDKATIGYTVILGLYKDTGITKSQFNNLNSIFYIGYLIAQWPGHILLQKLPIGKYLSFTILTWAIIIFITSFAQNYNQLAILRFLLGASESVVTPACEITLGMFLDPKQREFAQPIFWTSTAIAPFISSFIAFGLLKTEDLFDISPWRIFMIINSVQSVVLSIIVWFWYPDNPINAKFLSTIEKIHLIKKIQNLTKSSTEQKTIKTYQIKETLKDPISWLFFGQSFTLMLSNSLHYQQNQLFVDIGVDYLGSSLVSAAGSIWSVLIYIIFAIVIKKFPNQNGIIGIICLILPITASIAMCIIPWEYKKALLASMILAGSSKGVTYIVALGWNTSSASGYTKKLYRNVMFMIAYAVANILSPQLWDPKDSPRYIKSWVIQIIFAFALNGVILWIIRIILKQRNEERLHQIDDQDYFITNDEGIEERVDVAMLDLTDWENKKFIYPL